MRTVDTPTKREGANLKTTGEHDPDNRDAISSLTGRQTNTYGRAAGFTIMPQSSGLDIEIFIADTLEIS
jgi:hypothetical protein